MLKTLAVLFCTAFAGMGAWLILVELWRVSRVRMWPTVTGQVLNSDWGAGEGDSGGASYHVNVEYQYSISGSQYRASKSIIGPTLGLEKAQKQGAELFRSYAIGRELRIAYNPKRPAQSEIADEHQQRTNYGMILVGMVFIGVFSVLAYQAMSGW